MSCRMFEDQDVWWSRWLWVSECSCWYQHTWVVPEKGPLSGCVCVPGVVDTTARTPCISRTHARTNTHTHTRLTALFPGLPRWAGTRNIKPIWILLKQETVSGSGPYASLHLAPDKQPRQHPTTQFFTGRMPFLLPNQQCQSTEGTTPNVYTLYTTPRISMMKKSKVTLNTVALSTEKN